MYVHLVKWLGDAAKRTVAREKPFTIAITGAVGKSTTKEAVAAVLSARTPGSRIRVSEKNYNNELGLPLTIFDSPAPGHSVLRWLNVLIKAWFMSNGFQKTGVHTFILEMGADKPGDIAYLTSIAPPDIAIVTAVTPEEGLTPVHTANYSSVEVVAEEKSTLVKALKPEGTAILNADDKRVFAMRHLTTAHVLTFGETDASDVRLVASHVRLDAGAHGRVPQGLGISLQCLNRSQEVYVPGVFGRSIAYAVGAAMTVAETLDVQSDAAGRFASEFHPLPGRTRIIPGIKGTTLFDDSYNASPAAAVSALRDLAHLELSPGQRRAACLGEMRELGETAEAMHRLVGAEAARLGVDLLVACGIFAPAMAEGARANGLREDQVKILDDAPEAGRFLQDWIKPGDVILIKGSEGPLPSSPNWNKVTGVRMDRVVLELMAEPLRAKELLCRQERAWKRV